jgi:hypothetical protein
MDHAKQELNESEHLKSLNVTRDFLSKTKFKSKRLSAQNKIM